MGGWLLLFAPLSISTAFGQAPQPQFQIAHCRRKAMRAGHNGPGMIDVRQPSSPAEIVVSHHVDGDWLAYTQINNHGKQNIVSMVKLGWAYVMPTGLEVSLGRYRSDPGGALPPRGNSPMPEQGAAPRPTAKDFLDFVEEVTLADGTVVDADHAQIAAFYKECCTGTAAKAAPASSAAHGDCHRKCCAVRDGPPWAARQCAGAGDCSGAAAGPSDGDCRGTAIAERLAGERAAAQPQPVGLPYLPDGLGLCAAHGARVSHRRTGDAGTEHGARWDDGRARDQHVAPREGAKEFLFFVDEETQGDGTAWKTSHEKIEAQYRLCCSQRNATGAYAVAAATASEVMEPLSADLPIKFDVVSLRRAQEPGRGREMPNDGDFIAYHGSTMNALMQFAYLHAGFLVISNQPSLRGSTPTSGSFRRRWRRKILPRGRRRR